LWGLSRQHTKNIPLSIAEGVWSGKIVVNMSSSKLWKETMFGLLDEVTFNSKRTSAHKGIHTSVCRQIKKGKERMGGTTELKLIDLVLSKNTRITWVTLTDTIGIDRIF
jgi:hypothetical protein